jgi:ribosomal protein S18 acetylase RimI-like enzyme
MQLIRLPSTTAALVTSVLCESFHDYPVMRFVLGDTVHYDRQLDRLIGLFVAARTLLDDTVLGVMMGAQLVAVATTSNPAQPAHPQLAELRAEVWNSLGADAAARYQQCVQGWDSMASQVPQLHVNMIGVRREYQGQGLARRLLEQVHELAAQSGTAEGVSLTTEHPQNVAFYQHLGYHIIGQAQIAPGLQAWSFFRPNAITA